MTVTNRSDLNRQRQAMRQRIRALVTARRIAASVRLAEDEAAAGDYSANEPAP